MLTKTMSQVLKLIKQSLLLIAKISDGRPTYVSFLRDMLTTEPIVKLKNKLKIWHNLTTNLILSSKKVKRVLNLLKREVKLSNKHLIQFNNGIQITRVLKKFQTI